VTINLAKFGQTGLQPIVDPKTGMPTDYFLRMMQGDKDVLQPTANDLADLLLRTITAGAGLTGGGALGDGNLTFDVGAGTGIVVNADDVAIDTAAEAERIRDVIGAALVAGANITITVNDPGDTITIAGSVDTTAEAERIRDVIGAALVAGSNVTITVNDPGDTITIAASGGSGGTWSLIDDHTVGASEASHDVTVTAYDEVLVQFIDVTSAAANQRGVQVSTDGGSTFDTTSGNYVVYATAGTKSSLTQFNAHSTGSASARGGFVHIKGLRQTTGPKQALVGAADPDAVYLGSNAAITTVRCLTGAGASNMTGGRIITYGK